MSAISNDCFNKECICATCKKACETTPNHPQCEFVKSLGCDKASKQISCTYKIPMTKGEIAHLISTLK